MDGWHRSILPSWETRGDPGTKGVVEMQYHFERLSEDHRTAAIDILNYYVENGFAAFSENKLQYDLFDVYLQVSRGYPAIAVGSNSGETVGFAWLQAYQPSKAFQRVAEIGYFLRSDYTRCGIGKAILDLFVAEAQKLNIDSILASTSSLNEPSINFHLKNGFTECGRFHKIGRKFGRDFDLLWLQKQI
jgi:L-amino acid N-acyltransferase YncA